MKNGAILYFMNISKSVHRINDFSAYVKEIWLSPGNGSPQFLCSNKDKDYIASLVDWLYAIIGENVSHPKVKKDVKYIIDAFMNNDLSDDIFQNK